MIYSPGSRVFPRPDYIVNSESLFEDKRKLIVTMEIIMTSYLVTHQSRDQCGPIRGQCADGLANDGQAGAQERKYECRGGSHIEILLPTGDRICLLVYNVVKLKSKKKLITTSGYHRRLTWDLELQ